MDAPPPHAAPLRLALLGRWGVDCGGPVRLPYAKASALLVYLALAPGSQPRDSISALLWPEMPLEAGRANLRHAVHALRQAFGPLRLGGDRHSLRLCLQAGDGVDLAQLAGLAGLADLASGVAAADGPLPAANADALQGLLASYDGELMAGFSVPDAPDFMAWLDMQRLACHRLVLAACERLQAHLARGADLDRRIAVAQMQTRIDPWNEAFHQHLIGLLQAAGQVHSAVAHVDYLRALYRSELDAAPSDATEAMAGSLRVQLDQPPAGSPAAAALAVAALAATRTAAGGPAAIGATATGQVRPVAVLYLELRSLEALSDSVAEALQAARVRSLAEVEREGGHGCVTPDGCVLAYFGFPAGLPNASQRALRAALAAQRPVQQSPAPPWLCRAALHHGPMRLGSPAQPDATGQLSGVALHLAGQARHGELVASPAFARRLPARPWLALPAPAGDATGPARAMALRLGPPARQPTRRAAAPLGREAEQAQLRQLWRAVRRGGTRALVLSGAPGAGKTCLCDWMAAQATLAGASVLQLFHQPLRQQVPYAALAEALQLEMAPHGFDAWARAQGTGLTPDQCDLLRGLVGLPMLGATLPPTARRRRLHDAILALLRLRSADAPLLVVAEDLHWADASSLALLAECIAPAAPANWLVLGTTRPQADSPGLPGVPSLDLEPLAPAASRALAERHNPGLDGAAMAGITQRAQGNPLFIQTLSLAAVRQDQALGADSLEESLLGPLSNDDAARQVLQAAAALGERFDIELLQALPPGLDADRFHTALRRLQALGLVHLQGRAGRFHHALIRDAAHASLSGDDRRRLHAAIVGQSQRREPGLPAAQPAWLARHAALAGDPQAASQGFEQAAHQALALAAHTEAQAHFRDAWAHAERLPASPANDQRVMRLMLGEANATAPLLGYGAAPTRQAFQRVLERGAARPDDDDMFLAHYGLWLGGSSAGGYREALRYVARLQRIATLTGDPVQALQTDYAWGNTLLWLGELAPARAHLERAIALHDVHASPALLDRYFEDTGVIARSLLAWAVWLQGDEPQALALQQQALARALALQHPYSTAFALACAARLDVIRGDHQALAGHARQLAELSQRHDFAIWLALVAVYQGWLRCREGDAGGIAQSQSGLALVSMALPALEVTLLSVHVDALYRLGDLGACAAAADQALARCEHWDDRYMQAELLRLRAACAGPGSRPQTWLQPAQALAQAQGAQAWLQRLAAADANLY